MNPVTFTISRPPCYGDVHSKSGDVSIHQLLHHRGFTLVELSVSMAIAAIMVVGSVAVMRQQLDQSQVTWSSFFLRQTVISMQDFFVSENSSALINNSVMASSGAVARSYVGGGSGSNTQIFNTWGGRLFVGPLTSSTNSDWVLQASGLPMRLCSDIVLSLESTLSSAGLRYAMAGSAIAGTNITTPALDSVSLDAKRILQTSLINVHVLKNSPYAPLSPSKLSSLCETKQSYFNLFLTSSNNAL